MKAYLNKFIAVVYLAVTIFFVITLVRLNILPTVYLAAIIAVLALVSFILIKFIKKTVSAIIAVLLIALLAFASFNMASTLDFFVNISDEKQVQNFYVVVMADSEYEEIVDIDGETVGIMTRGGRAYTDAQDKLSEKVDVVFEEADNYDVLAQSLINGKYEVIFINSAYYEMALEYVDGFSKDSTRILEESTGLDEMKSDKKAVNVTKDSFNMYISGIDTSGSIGNISRSDVNMIVTVNPSDRTILLTSIPRDYYVELGTIGQLDKLTHSGLYGINETTATIEKLFGVDINYYAKVNFTTVVNLVDALGGITVDSDYSFYGGGYYFNAGENYLNGDQALAFARERYSFTEGDRQRVKNQQAVITGVINKVTGSTAILTNYNSILNSVENNFQTNLTQKDMTSLVKMQLKDMGGWTIIQQSVNGSGYMTPVYSMPHVNVYVMQPDESTVLAATEKIKEVMANTNDN